MVKGKRGQLAIEATRRNAEQVVRLGQGVRAARIRRHLTQQQLADRAGIARSTESAIERGLGASHTLDTWQRIAVALDVPLRVELGRDPHETTTDAMGERPDRRH